MLHKSFHDDLLEIEVLSSSLLSNAQIFSIKTAASTSTDTGSDNSAISLSFSFRAVLWAYLNPSFLGRFRASSSSYAVAEVVRTSRSSS